MGRIVTILLFLRKFFFQLSRSFHPVSEGALSAAFFMRVRDETAETASETGGGS
jgi:hypothetical protein